MSTRFLPVFRAPVVLLLCIIGQFAAIYGLRLADCVVETVDNSTACAFSPSYASHLISTGTNRPDDVLKQQLVCLQYKDQPACPPELGCVWEDSCVFFGTSRYGATACMEPDTEGELLTSCWGHQTEGDCLSEGRGGCLWLGGTCIYDLSSLPVFSSSFGTGSTWPYHPALLDALLSGPASYWPITLTSLLLPQGPSPSSATSSSRLTSTSFSGRRLMATPTVYTHQAQAPHARSLQFRGGLVRPVTTFRPTTSQISTIRLPTPKISPIVQGGGSLPTTSFGFGSRTSSVLDDLAHSSGPLGAPRTGSTFTTSTTSTSDSATRQRLSGTSSVDSAPLLPLPNTRPGLSSATRTPVGRTRLEANERGAEYMTRQQTKADVRELSAAARTGKKIDAKEWTENMCKVLGAISSISTGAATLLQQNKADLCDPDWDDATFTLQAVSGLASDACKLGKALFTKDTSDNLQAAAMVGKRLQEMADCQWDDSSAGAASISKDQAAQVAAADVITLSSSFGFGAASLPDRTRDLVLSQLRCPFGYLRTGVCGAGCEWYPEGLSGPGSSNRCARNIPDSYAQLGGMMEAYLEKDTSTATGASGPVTPVSTLPQGVSVKPLNLSSLLRSSSLTDSPTGSSLSSTAGSTRNLKQLTAIGTSATASSEKPLPSSPLQMLLLSQAKCLKRSNDSVACNAAAFCEYSSTLGACIMDSEVKAKLSVAIYNFSRTALTDDVSCRWQKKVIENDNGILDCSSNEDETSCSASAECSWLSSTGSAASATAAANGTFSSGCVFDDIKALYHIAMDTLSSSSDESVPFATPVDCFSRGGEECTTAGSSVDIPSNETLTVPITIQLPSSTSSSAQSGTASNSPNTTQAIVQTIAAGAGVPEDLVEVQGPSAGGAGTATNSSLVSVAVLFPSYQNDQENLFKLLVGSSYSSDLFRSSPRLAEASVVNNANGTEQTVSPFGSTIATPSPQPAAPVKVKSGVHMVSRAIEIWGWGLAVVITAAVIGAY